MNKSSAAANKFQSTLPHGERHKAYKSGSVRPAFQSTLPHGERLTPFKIIQGSVSFNPRSRTGSDITTVITVVSSTSFQSTLPHGERHGCLLESLWRYEVSIHAPRTGSDLVYVADAFLQVGFQSTLPHGERQPVITKLIV